VRQALELLAKTPPPSDDSLGWSEWLSIAAATVAVVGACVSIPLSILATVEREPPTAATKMLVGANVREGFPTGEAQSKTQTDIFASGFEDGRRVTIGASLKGRVWSYLQARSIKHWADWCDHIGAKLGDETIDIDEVMGSFIKPLELTERPALVALGIELGHRAR
jgi:hypothetical protein